MRMLTRLTLLIAALGSLALAGDHFLLRTAPSKIAGIAQRYGLTVVSEGQGSGNGLYVVRANQAAIQAAALDPNVITVEEDKTVVLPEAAAAASSAPALPLKTASYSGRVVFSAPTGSDAWLAQPAGAVINLPGARTFATGAGLIAILDTGVDPKSPLLSGVLRAGFDFTRNRSGGSEMADLNQSTTAILDQSTTAILDQSTTAILDVSGLPAAFGHGTMVAGLAHLVAPTAAILPVKVFTADGVSTISQIVAGIYYAVDQGATVINMSFSTTESSIELKRAVNYANSRRVTLIASAGNGGSQIVTYPASYVIGVGSTNNALVRSLFSNYGSSSVTLAAPGESLLTLYPGNHYAIVSGTSFSAPLVAGGAALLVQLAAGTNQSQAVQALTQALPIGQGLGAGELNLFAACLYRAVRSGDGTQD